MKRKLIFVIWILLFFGFVLVNCNAQTSTNDQKIIGTWIYTGDGYTLTYVFNANGSGTWTSTRSGDTPNVTFTYGLSISGEIITVGWGRSDSKIYFSPDGKTMILNGVIYRKK